MYKEEIYRNTSHGYVLLMVKVNEETTINHELGGKGCTPQKRRNLG